MNGNAIMRGLEFYLEKAVLKVMKTCSLEEHQANSLLRNLS